MPVTLTAIDRSLVPVDGGYELILTGTFEVGTTHRVHIGPTGTDVDPVAYAGQGKGLLATPLTTTQMRVFTPRLSLGGPHDVLVVQVSTSDTSTLGAVLEAVYPDYKTLVFDMRRVLPPFYRTGPRNMDFLPQVIP